MMLTVRGKSGGAVIGYVERYTETERKKDRWNNGSTVERVYWRAIPFETGQQISYHIRKREAVAAVRKCGSST